MKLSILVGVLFVSIIVSGTGTHDIWAYVYGIPKDEQFTWPLNSIMIAVCIGVMWIGQCLWVMLERRDGDVRIVSNKVPTIPEEEC